MADPLVSVIDRFEHLTAGVGTVVRVALRVSRALGRVPAWAHSFAPVSRSTYSAGTSSLAMETKLTSFGSILAARSTARLRISAKPPGS